MLASNGEGSSLGASQWRSSPRTTKAGGEAAEAKHSKQCIGVPVFGMLELVAACLVMVLCTRPVNHMPL